MMQYDLPLPQADAVFAPRVLQNGQELFWAKFFYGEILQMVEWVEYVQ